MATAACKSLEEVTMNSHKPESIRRMCRLSAPRAVLAATAAAILWLAGHAPASIADQNDPRLDTLFQELKDAADERSGDRITGAIWEIWREHADDQVNRLMVEGVASMSRGDLQTAADTFGKIIEIDPEFAEGWNKRATVLFFMGKFQESAADVRETLRLEPRHFGAVAGMGLIFLSADHYEAALTAFKQALQINPHLSGPKIQIQKLETMLEDNPV